MIAMWSSDRLGRSLGSITAQVIGGYFSGHFAFMDARLFANPMFLLRVVLSISGSIWLAVRLLRHRIGTGEFVVFCALYSFNILNIAMTLVDIGRRAIEQLVLPLTEQGETHELLEAIQLLGLLAFLFWIALHAVRTFAKIEPLSPWQVQICADEPAPASGWPKVALRLAGAPRNIGISDRKVTTALLMYFANLSSYVPMIVVVGTIPGLVFSLINLVKLMAGAFHLKSVLDQAGEPMPLHFWLTPPYQLVLSIGIEALKAGVLLGLAYVLRKWALRYVQKST